MLTAAPRAALVALGLLIGAQAAADHEPLDAVAMGLFTRGVNYALGRGFVQDYAKAADWYRRAAERGYAPAQHSLAQLYAAGLGVAQDDVEAFVWFRLAAKRGHAHAVDGLNALIARMPADAVARASRRARLWRPTTE